MDLFISISYIDNNLKLWNISNFECLLNIKNVNKTGHLKSACFLKDNNFNYIITSNSSNNSAIKSELIKVFDFKGTKIKNINGSNEKVDFINTYYDERLSKNFIIVCSRGYSKSYDYKENKIYHKYSDNFNEPCNFVINNKGKVVELIESNFDGNIRIWNFHSALLLNKINVSDCSLREICLWDKVYLFVGCDDNSVKLIEYKNGKIIKELKGHNAKVLSIKKITLPKFGACLLSQGSEINSIKLWLIK